MGQLFTTYTYLKIPYSHHYTHLYTINDIEWIPTYRNKITTKKLSFPIICWSLDLFLLLFSFTLCHGNFPVIEDTQIQGRMVVSHNVLNFHPNLSGKCDLRIVFRRVGSTTTALSQPKNVQLPNWKAPTPKQKQAKSKVIPLMVQKSGDHQLEAGSLSTMIYGFYHVFLCIRGGFLAGFLNHQ